MSKELEALEDLINFIGSGEIVDTHEICEYVAKRKDIIETALKRLENYEKNEDFNKDVLNYVFLNEQDKIKKLKALEIIKKDENLVIAIMSNCKGGEEYELLKEVLL